MPKLTKRVVDAAEVREKDYVIWDDELPGFGLRVFKSGKRSYVLQYRAAGRSCRYSNGLHGIWTPDTARKEARVQLGKKAKEVNQRLGDPADLPSVEEAQHLAANEMKPAFLRWRAELTEQAKMLRSIQEKQKDQFLERHRQDRLELEKTQLTCRLSEQEKRQDRFNKGLRGLWDRLRGAHGKIKKRNEQEALELLARDRREKDDLIFRQLERRTAL